MQKPGFKIFVAVAHSLPFYAQLTLSNTVMHKKKRYVLLIIILHNGATDVGSTLHYYYSQVYISAFVKVLSHNTILFFNRRSTIACFICKRRRILFPTLIGRR